MTMHQAVEHEETMLGATIVPRDFISLTGCFVLTYEHGETLRFAVFGADGRPHTSGILEQGRG